MSENAQRGAGVPRRCPSHPMVETTDERCRASLGSDGQGPIFCQQTTRPVKETCCGLMWEHGALTQRHLACFDCPERYR